MADYRLFRNIVRELALGHGAQTREFLAQMRDEEQREYVNYVSAMFAEITDFVFDEDHGLVAIKKFVDEMAYAYRKTDPPFKPLAMEAMIRVLFYEDQTLDEVDPEHQLRLQIMAIRMYVDQNPAVFAQLETFLDKAEVLALEWEGES